MQEVIAGHPIWPSSVAAFDLILRAERWQAWASCSDSEPEVFFPALGTSYSKARAICARCPVRVECRSWCDEIEGEANAAGLAGVYAGEGPKDRVARRRRA